MATPEGMETPEELFEKRVRLHDWLLSWFQNFYVGLGLEAQLEEAAWRLALKDHLNTKHTVFISNLIL